MQNQNFLIVGLGNPERKYDDTPHNIGFEVINELLVSQKIEMQKENFNAKYCSFKLGEKNIILIKPLSYMNLSGKPILSFVKFYKIQIDNVFIFYDDIDLQIGKIKIRQNNNSGGHNGIKSIDSSIGSGYIKIRIGVGRPENKEISIADYVLQKMTEEKIALINKKIKCIAQHMDILIDKKYDLFMQKIHNMSK